ncbi:MAG: sulfite exporter TauE/SafE family protein [Limisphaerales bacterium]
MTEWPVILLVGFAVVFIGLSKAGFGGGLGMLTTPLCVVAFGMAGQSPQFAVGFLLPLLCAGDSFSLYHYWRQWRLENLKYLLPGVILGVIAGIQLMDRMEPRHFSLIIGVLAVSFVVFQLVKEKVFKNETPFVPGYGTGSAAGIGAGSDQYVCSRSRPDDQYLHDPSAVIQGGICLHPCSDLYVD